MTLVLQLVLVSGVQQRAMQQQAFDRLRSELAQGIAPIGPVDAEGAALEPGRPIAHLEIPSIGLRQVIVEGTAASTLFAGPGHRRDTPFPGQAGVSVVMGRRASYGGPFARVRDLRQGDRVRVTTGQGTFDYRVLGVREEGATAPPAPASDESRLLLATADGGPFLPSGVLRVDAEMEGAASPGPRPLYSASSLPAEEHFLAGDARTLWALALWLQLVLALVLALVWAWHRWGRARGWLLLLPPLLLTALSVSGEIGRLLPNLL